jgi:hypothetical protein
LWIQSRDPWPNPFCSCAFNQIASPIVEDKL